MNEAFLWGFIQAEWNREPFASVGERFLIFCNIFIPQRIMLGEK